MASFDIGKKTIGEDNKLYITLKDKKSKTYLATISLPIEYAQESLKWSEVVLK